MANVPITSLPEAISPSANDYLILQGKNTQRIKWSVLLDKLYPVGCIYQSASSTSPASFLGGTWERVKDCFILAAGDTYAAGSTGGEAAHKLVYSELPLRTTVNGQNTAGKTVGTTGILSSWVNVAENDFVYSTLFDGKQSGVNDEIFSGFDTPHNNMPPYTAMYIWKRIA